jgi:hypothetical protein
LPHTIVGNIYVSYSGNLEIVKGVRGYRKRGRKPFLRVFPTSLSELG